MNKRLCRAICLLLIIFFALSCDKAKVSGSAAPGEKAPNFTLSDLKGDAIRLSDYNGKVVMLEFWATWCLPCKDAIPDMNALYEKYKDKGFVLFGISMDVTGDFRANVGPFAKEHSIRYPILHDTANINAMYGVYSIPTTVIIDRQGNVKSVHAGFNSYLGAKLSKEIETLL